jgi:hypothetical protein
VHITSICRAKLLGKRETACCSPSQWLGCSKLVGSSTSGGCRPVWGVQSNNTGRECRFGWLARLSSNYIHSPATHPPPLPTILPLTLPPVSSDRLCHRASCPLPSFLHQPATQQQLNSTQHKTNSPRAPSRQSFCYPHFHFVEQLNSLNQSPG